ncbi:MAG TPA: DUF2148 domain-containing protein [Candidatus Lokiarchaeia archaeon]|nr:DUF2148 domain-containing protein [Candidatus Lokiarchaeia archaeon]
MPELTAKDLESSAINTTLALMAAAARTAPKAKGIDALVILALDGPEKQEIADTMKAYASEDDPSRDKWLRDANNVEDADALFIIGLKKRAGSAGLNCQACGFDDCAAFDDAPTTEGIFRGPTCAFKLTDLGIAIGSAVKTAGILNVDNRIMYRAGVAVMRSRWGAKMCIAYGIPLKISGKSPFFDRPL